MTLGGQQGFGSVEAWAVSHSWDFWRHCQTLHAHAERLLAAHPDWTDARIARKASTHNGRLAEEGVTILRRLLSGEDMTFATHRDMCWGFYTILNHFGWAASTDHTVRRVAAEGRHFRLDTVGWYPPESTADRRPRYVIECKVRIASTRELRAAVHQVSAYCDALVDTGTEEPEAIVTAATITAPDAREYGEDRGVAVLTNAELADLLKLRGWLDRDAEDAA